MKTYSRDKRSPPPSSEKASKLMSSIKGKDTLPELMFRKMLRQNGLTGYRLHWKVAGRPDIAFPGKRLAIFIHGCYWHSCPTCKLAQPKSNSSFWQEKLAKNISRDVHKKTLLENAGWQVLVFWECQVKKEVSSLVSEVRHSLVRKNSL